MTDSAMRQPDLQSLLGELRIARLKIGAVLDAVEQDEGAVAVERILDGASVISGEIDALLGLVPRRGTG